MSAKETPNDKRTAATDIFGSVELLTDVGLDADGRSHFYSSDRDAIIVYGSDRRGVGVRDTEIACVQDLEGRPVEDWVKYVRKKAGWADLNWEAE